MALPSRVQLMAEAAFGTVSRRDLTAAGYPEETVDWWRRVGLLESCGRGELRIPGSERSVLQALRIVLNRAGPGAVLGGAVNLGLRGVEGFTHCVPEPTEEDPTRLEIDHVIVPSGRTVLAVGFTVVRRVVPDEDRDWLLGLPAVTTARALIGAAATHHTARVRVAFDDARRKGLVTEAQFDARSTGLGRTHGAPQARAMLRSGKLRMESEPERDLFDIFQPGDPLPDPQVWVCWHGKYYRLDFAYPEACLDLEYDGGGHGARREQDADRDLALAELQIQSLRITKAMMRDPAGTRRRILAVREQRMALGLPPIVPDPPPWLGRTLGG